MIVNATLLRIDARGTPDPLGRESWTTGPELALACCVTEPTVGQTRRLGATIQDATVAIYLLESTLAGRAIEPGDRLMAAPRSRPAGLYQVIHLVSPTHGHQSHIVAFCRKVRV